MNKGYTIAAVLMAVTGLAHVFAGGPSVYQPLLEVAPTDELRLYVSLLWHFVTAFFAIGTVLLVFRAKGAHDGGSSRAIGLLLLAMGLLFFIYGLVQVDSILIAPQWVLAIPLGGYLSFRKLGKI